MGRKVGSCKRTQQGNAMGASDYCKKTTTVHFHEEKVLGDKMGSVNLLSLQCWSVGMRHNVVRRYRGTVETADMRYDIRENEYDKTGVFFFVFVIGRTILLFLGCNLMCACKGSKQARKTRQASICVLRLIVHPCCLRRTGSRGAKQDGGGGGGDLREGG